MSRRYDSDAPRGLGVITSVHGRDSGKGFIFATTADQQEVFLHKSTFRPMELYDQIAMGDGVSFGLVEAPKGLRGHDVRRMTDSERETFDGAAASRKTDKTESRGNTARHGRRMSHVQDDYVEDRRRRDTHRR